MAEADTSQGPLDESFARVMTERALAAFNAHDPRRIGELLTEDVVYQHSAAPTTLRGRSEVEAFYASWSDFPDARLDLDDGPFLDPRAPKASVVWRFSGTNTGPIDPPGFAATGRRVELRVFEVAEFRDGLTSRARIVIDMADFMRQLGLLAAPGSRAERAMVALQRLQTKLSRRRSSSRL